MRECDGQRFIPAVQYYQMNGEPGGGESAFLAKVQNATTMASYFGDFKILMQRAKDFGKPVIILLEADGFGFLEQQTGGNSARLRRDRGQRRSPSSAGLPNTVAGWGLAFLQLRKAVGASNAMLGIHISGWASGKDIAYGSRHRSARTRGRQGLRLPGAVRPRRQRHRRDVGRAGRRSARPRLRLLRAGAGAEPLVGRERQRLDQLEELQPLRRVAAAVEREGERSAGCSGRSRSATPTTATSPTTAARAPATRTTAPSTSSATAPRTWRSSPTRA